MSLAAVEAQDWVAQSARRRSTAVGPEARRIVREEESSESAVSAWQLSMQAAMRELGEIIEETSSPGWDGGDARPLSWRAADALANALATLTPHVPMPEIVPEPDGGVAMQWSRGRTRSLIVSFGPDGGLFYAVHTPGRRETGRRRFYVQLPPDLLEIAKEATAGDP